VAGQKQQLVEVKIPARHHQNQRKQRPNTGTNAGKPGLYIGKLPFKSFDQIHGPSILSGTALCICKKKREMTAPAL
jgi:hypothetical protein